MACTKTPTKYAVLLLLFLFSAFISAQNKEQKEFEMLKNSKNWELSFEDSCKQNWTSHWFLDGLRADIKNSENGMLYSAGTVNRDDACHAVLWTKKSFSGTVKIEYDYTRTDARVVWVNILYILATGVDLEHYDKDITKWNALRIIPSMRNYFKNMNAYQISYAAFKGNNEDPEADYIRLRQYPTPNRQEYLKGSEIPEASYATGLFNPGVQYHITAIKTSKKIYFNVSSENESTLFSWDLREKSVLEEGRIGLRHMYTRSALYKNFKIFENKKNN